MWQADILQSVTSNLASVTSILNRPTMETERALGIGHTGSFKCSNKSARAGATVATLDELVKELNRAFQKDLVNVDYVRGLLEAYKSNPTEWKKFAKFDRYRYTRNLVDQGNGKFNLMILCWGEGHGSAIHDHADSHCFMKVLQGSLSEVRFSWPEDSPSKDDDNIQETGGTRELNEICRNSLRTNDVCYINDSLGIHRVENTSHTERAVSLHLYCPPFDTCSVFNQNTGRRSKCQVTFWSKFGDKRNRWPNGLSLAIEIDGSADEWDIAGCISVGCDEGDFSLMIYHYPSMQISHIFKHPKFLRKVSRPWGDIVITKMYRTLHVLHPRNHYKHIPIHRDAETASSENIYAFMYLYIP
uniref:cysteine dioxygenase n=1 Tax=Timema californicum TaxID=61474 RepID=A0A7R9J875_TIMCA|nr:unnamed protein product [Timema californicum]